MKNIILLSNNYYKTSPWHLSAKFPGFGLPWTSLSIVFCKFPFIPEQITPHLIIISDKDLGKSVQTRMQCFFLIMYTGTTYARVEIYSYLVTWLNNNLIHEND